MSVVWVVVELEARPRATIEKYIRVAWLCVNTVVSLDTAVRVSPRIAIGDGDR